MAIQLTEKIGEEMTPLGRKVFTEKRVVYKDIELGSIMKPNTEYENVIRMRWL